MMLMCSDFLYKNMGSHLNYPNKFIKAYVEGTYLNCLDLFI